MTGQTKDDKMNDVPMMTEDVILSVHIPKSAGITLYSMYKEAYGEHLVEDYPGRDAWNGVKRPAKVIHGHFELHQYLHSAPRPRVVTFVREPLARAISHFYYWENPPDYEPRDHPLYLKHFVHKRPDLHDFLLDPALANIMSSFLYPFSLPRHFYFVGVCEHFDDDVAQLRAMLGLPEQSQPRLNEGLVKPTPNVPSGVAQAFYSLHKLDKAFYDDVLAHRQWRIENPRWWKLGLCSDRLTVWLMTYRRSFRANPGLS
jgi:hypothetical protein